MKIKARACLSMREADECARATCSRYFCKFHLPSYKTEPRCKSQFLSHRLRSDEFFPLCPAPSFLFASRCDIINRWICFNEGCIAYETKVAVCHRLQLLWRSRNLFENFIGWDFEIWEICGMIGVWLNEFFWRIIVYLRDTWNMFECKECSFKIGLVELFSSFFNLEYN